MPSFGRGAGVASFEYALALRADRFPVSSAGAFRNAVGVTSAFVGASDA